MGQGPYCHQQGLSSLQGPSEGVLSSEVAGVRHKACERMSKGFLQQGHPLVGISLIILQGKGPFTECSPPLGSRDDTFQAPYWMPEAVDSSKLCIHCFFLYLHTYDKV